MRAPPRPPPPAGPDTAAARNRAHAARLGTVPPAFVARDVLELAGEVDRLRAELAGLRAACVIGLPYAKGEAADVLRDVIAHAKGRDR
jgi:hypothetical protein